MADERHLENHHNEQVALLSQRTHDASCLSVVSFNIPTAQFLPRDAMHKLGLCRHAVSVCLSRS